MRIKQMLSVSLCTLMLVGAFDVKAADDSYVDLSVLNSLQPGDSLFVETQPLFPIVQKDTSSAQKIKKAKKKSTKKQTKKTQKQEITKAQELKKEVKTQEIKKPEEKIEILPQTPEIPQPLQEVKKTTDAALTNISQTGTQAPSTAEITAPTVAPGQTTTDMKGESQTGTQAPSTAEITAPTVAPGQTTTDMKGEAQTGTQAPSTAEITSPTAAPGQTTANTQGEAQTVAPTLPAASVQNSEDTQQANAPVPSQVSAPEKTDQSSADMTMPSTENKTTENKVQPLIPQASVAENVAPQEEIRFAESSYEISEENKQKILSLIETFENPKKNKIAIYAYNYDNGENSFKKKKLSLDRATEIRSLLLNQGYKNFSIKVINVTDSPSKSNLVEIEEIK